MRIITLVLAMLISQGVSHLSAQSCCSAKKSHCKGVTSTDIGSSAVLAATAPMGPSDLQLKRRGRGSWGPICRLSLCCGCGGPLGPLLCGRPARAHLGPAPLVDGVKALALAVVTLATALALGSRRRVLASAFA